MLSCTLHNAVPQLRGYYNSFILQALELLPGRAQLVQLVSISVGLETKSDTLLVLLTRNVSYKNVPVLGFKSAASGLPGRCANHYTTVND